MPTALLTDRAIVAVSGPQSESFLQNIITADLDGLDPAEIKPSALLTPQGKILFDFLVSRADAQSFLLECRADIADDFVRRLMLYRLRAKVEIARQDQSTVAVSWDCDSSREPSGKGWLRDLRFGPSGEVRRSHVSQAADSDSRAWTDFRIERGIAESGADYALGDAFPHDVLLDEVGGVGFRKGCYVGQEVVSRMQHRGTARRRVLIVSADSGLPASGTPVTVAGRQIGALGSVAGGKGLAILRIDRVKEALDTGSEILADATPLGVAIPAFARFAYPQQGESSDD